MNLKADGDGKLDSPSGFRADPLSQAGRIALRMPLLRPQAKPKLQISAPKPNAVNSALLMKAKD